MVQRTSVRQQRALKDFGINIRRWRKVNGMSASDLATRAFVTRETLRNIESGSGSPRADSVFAVLTALGIVETILAASNPFNNETARARIDDILNSGGEL
jgi:transcriptional regulator with XRE-family HTH domain